MVTGLPRIEIWTDIEMGVVSLKLNLTSFFFFFLSFSQPLYNQPSDTKQYHENIKMWVYLQSLFLSKEIYGTRPSLRFGQIDLAASRIDFLASGAIRARNVTAVRVDGVITSRPGTLFIDTPAEVFLLAAAVSELSHFSVRVLLLHRFGVNIVSAVSSLRRNWLIV